MNHSFTTTPDSYHSLVEIMANNSFALIEKFVTDNVEYNAWVTYFRNTSKDEVRSFGKSSEED